MKHLNLLVLCVTIVGTTLFAQPPNDSIYWRIPLVKNAPPHPSTTEGCTVEWTCVDESLTGQCIEYHNDQWFSISPQRKGTTYLNLTVSRCKDIRGVQVVIFSGTPCETQTYEPLVCYSMGAQGDIFLALDMLNPREEYLVGIDGYLHDLCDFTIQWSDEPVGFPAEPVRLNIGEARVMGGYVELDWKLPKEYGSEVTSFVVLRRGVRQGRAQVLDTLAMKAFANGEMVRDYRYLDSIPNQDPQEYTVWAQRLSGVPVLVMKHAVRPYRRRGEWVLVLDYPTESILVYDLKNGLSGDLLDSGFYSKVQDQPRLITYDLLDWINEGIRSFEVTVINGEGQVLDTFFYVPD